LPPTSSRAAGRAAALAACPQPDILVNNAGGPPPGDFRNWSRDDWLAALDANMLAPIELIKATVDPMIASKFGRIVNITSGAVKMPIDVLGLSNGARSGLTGFVAGLARKTVAHNVTINNLLPGFFDTDRIATVIGGQAKARGGLRTGAGRARGRRFRRAASASRGIRRRLRLAVFSAGRLHHRAELAARRRRLSGHLLNSRETHAP
jgi:NAD(P)-dependent dehydrogenase (short-subunit alcohol dehydrogenase family)